MATHRPIGTGAATQAADGTPRQDSKLDRKYAQFASRYQGSPGARAGLKAAVFVVGLLFVLVGLALTVLPGPLTIPPVLAGVYIWSLEFPWARRLRVRVNKSAREAWRNAQAHPARAIAVTVLGLVAAGVAIWAVGHFDLIQKAKDLI